MQDGEEAGDITQGAIAMDFRDQLDIYLRARFTLIVLVTLEEQRALDTLKTCGRKSSSTLTDS